MANTFKVWLVGYAQSRKFQYDCYGRKVMDSIAARLDTLFDDVCGKSEGLSGADVTWEKGAPEATDVVVYVFYGKGDSNIAKGSGQPVHDSASGGTFASADGMMCEVYLEPMDGAAGFVNVVSNLIFHEIMHNKLDASPPTIVADIHTGGGGGLAAATISASSSLTDENKIHMAKGMAREVKQYTAGMISPKT